MNRQIRYKNEINQWASSKHCQEIPHCMTRNRQRYDASRFDRAFVPRLSRLFNLLPPSVFHDTPNIHIFKFRVNTHCDNPLCSPYVSLNFGGLCKYKTHELYWLYLYTHMFMCRQIKDPRKSLDVENLN